jgi:[ribosomal protein S5]-alanine N-acetyltransferase
VIDEIRTSRLLLSRPQPADWENFARIHQDPKVMATLGGLRPTEQIRTWFDRILARWDEHHFGWWMARDLESGAFAGRGGLSKVLIEGRDEVEVGYGFLPEFWGRGLATELARESVRVGFGVLGLPELVSFTQVTNLASRRVMKKAGFHYERDFVYAGLPHVLYRQLGQKQQSQHQST